MRLRSRRLHTRLLTATAIAVGLLSICRGQSTQLVSLSTNGDQGNLQSGGPKLSADGRHVAFISMADNLVPGDTLPFTDVFVRDRLLGTTERVSVDSVGTEAAGETGVDALTRDGRYVVLASHAPNLVPGDFNLARDIFVHDRATSTTTRVNVGPAGVEANANTFPGSSISDDGRYVAFTSTATNLIAGDTNAADDIFVRDRMAGTTTRVSVDASGGEANGRSYHPSFSADGRYIAFVSDASNLVAGDTNGRADVFVRDLSTGAVKRVSVSSSGVQANADSQTGVLSADATCVAFDSMAWNLVSGDTNSNQDVFVHEIATGTTTRVSVYSNGNQGFRGSFHPSISSDGGLVTFSSDEAFVLSDPFFAVDIFLHDRATALTTQISVDSLGAQGTAPSTGSAHRSMISADGRCIAYSSSFTNLVPADRNADVDVFVRVPEPFPPFAYCFGHNAGECPCSPGAVGHGCPNSIFATGALLAASGVSSVAADTLALNASSMSGFLCLFFQGTGHADEPFGDGKLCLSGTMTRVGSYTAVGGAATNPSGVDLPISVKGNVPASGTTRYYQAVYRNADPTFCTVHRHNRTNGIAIVWYP